MHRAVVWSDEREPGLGAALIGEIGATLRRIEQRPLGYPAIHGALRRALTRRFPCAVFYLEVEGDVTVVAVPRQRQDRQVLDAR
ncbi:MAG: hypothetical protein SFW09_19000 [Hyphomicrobiaceae bacterium]|nr:hypothetical protein [Hyphomicrobiaceae bacterium]